MKFRSPDERKAEDAFFALIKDSVWMHDNRPGAAVAAMPAGTRAELAALRSDNTCLHPSSTELISWDRAHQARGLINSRVRGPSKSTIGR